MYAQSRSVVANHVGFWGLQRWFESSRDYFSDARVLQPRVHRTVITWPSVTARYGNH